MRECHRARFITKKNARYDVELGMMIDEGVEEVVLPCFISDMGMELKNQLFNKVNVDGKIIRLNKPYLKSFDYVNINDKMYVETLMNKGFMNRRNIIYVGEVNLNGESVSKGCKGFGKNFKTSAKERSY